MNPNHLAPLWLQDRLLGAIESFNLSDDLILLRNEETDDGESNGAVGERAITHRLAVHLENEFLEQGYPNKDAKIAIDCEYNRHRGAVKAHFVKGRIKEQVEDAKKKVLKEHPTKKGWYAFSIYPDIIVHERSQDIRNLIVIELKRASNTIDDKLDKLKLELFVTQNQKFGYGYVLGASVIAYDDDKFGERRLEPSEFFVDSEFSQ